MIELLTQEIIPYLIINGKIFDGWYADPNSLQVIDSNKGIPIFNNYTGNKKEYDDFWNIIKEEKFKNFPSGLILMIDQFSNDTIVSPLQAVPFPFWSINFIKNEKGYFISYSAMIDIDVKNEEKQSEWYNKWTIEYYYKELKKKAIESEINVVKSYESDDYVDLEVKIKIIPNENLEEDFNKSIIQLNTLLDSIEPKLKGFDDLLSLSELWKNKDKIQAEKSWQTILKSNSWILSAAFSQPLILFKDEGFLGGKSIRNKGGKIVDFVYKNRLTNSICLVEIKTPNTKIIGTRYRDTFSFSKELIGGLNQTLDYINTLSKEYYSIRTNSANDFNFFNPRALLVIGTIKELDNEKRKAFELFRNSISKVEILTFDELFEKIFMILSLAKSNDLK